MTAKLFFNGSGTSTAMPGLWVTDAYQATELMIAGADPSGLNPRYLISFADKLYFSGSDANGFLKLWISDGTEAGTTALAISGAPANLAPQQMTASGRKLYFTGFDATVDGLYVSDGTAAGTRELIIAGSSSSGLEASNLTAFDGKLYFEGTDSDNHQGLWVTDGTDAGTTELAVAGAASQGLNPSSMAAFAGNLFFRANDIDGHSNLWISDGTGQNTNELPISGQSVNGLTPSSLTSVGNKLYFRGLAVDGHAGLWVSNGTAGGTSELTPTGVSATGLNPTNLLSFNGMLYFSGRDASDHYGLWISDGTNAGTFELAITDANASGLDPVSLAVFQGHLYFTGDGPANALDLFISNGAGNGTVRLIPAGAAGPGLNAHDFAVLYDPAPSGLTLDPNSDSGTLGDNVTTDTSPVITGTGTPDDTVVLYDSDGVTVIDAVLVDQSGHWAITAVGLSAGIHTLTALEVDPNDNTTPISLPLVLTIVVPPAAPVDLSLAPATDSGSIGDNITNVTVPAIIGSGTPGDTVTLYDTDGTTPVGSAVVDQSGTWVITTIALTNGVHSLTAKQTDVNSTASVASAALVLTIDNAEPAPTGLALAAASDSGLVGDRVTSVTTPVITGSGIPGDTVTLYDGLTVVGTAVVAGNGTWSVTSAMLAAGVHSLTSTQTDIAGNISPASAALALTITSLSAALAANPHNGNGVVYNELFHGAADPNVTVTISDNGVVIGTAMADADGAWSFDLAVLEAGGHALSASVTDLNGHVSTTPVVPLTLDAQSLPDTRFSLVSTNASGHFFGSDYAGPTDYLQAEYGYDGTDNVFIVANVANVFLYSGTGGQDVMVAKAGSNVLDGRSGSNWMVGATGEDGGTDTFFVDNRSGQVAWSSLVNFHAGDMLTLWGFDPVGGVAQFSDNMGAAGYQGTTLQATLGDGSGGVDTVTFVGLSADTAQFTTSTGTAGGVNYMAVTRVS